MPFNARTNLGGLTALAVANIDDPSAELSAISGTAKGDRKLVFQPAAGSDEWTLYAWDDASTDPEAIPATVDGLTGQWIAVAGKYNYSTPGGGSGGTLDTSYDFGGPGLGRTVTADAGAVRIEESGNGALVLGAPTTEDFVWWTGSLTPQIYQYREAAGPHIYHFAETASSTAGGAVIYARDKSDTGAHTIVANNDVVMQHYAFGSDGTDYAELGHFEFFVNGTPGNDVMPGGFQVWLSPAGSQTPTQAFRLEADRSATFYGDISADTDADANFVFGRSRIDSRDTDVSFFSHIDHSSNSAYALKQTAAGITTVNSAATEIDFRIGGTLKVKMEANQVRLHNIAGTAALPAIAIGATDRGFYVPGANQIGVSTAGVLAAYWDSAQHMWCENGISANQGSDETSVLGRCQFDSRVTTHAFFSNYGHTGNTEYALKQELNGDTVLNALTGQEIDFGINGVRSAVISTTALTLEAGVNLVVDSGGASDPQLMADTVDPSAASGIAAPEGSILMRYVATAGEAWIKDGAADTAWTQLGVGGGAHPDPHALALGSESAPAYAFSGDTDTGMWSPSADILAFSTGATEALRIDASQNSTFAGDIKIGLNNEMQFDDDGNTNLVCLANDDLRLYVGGTVTKRYQAGTNTDYIKLFIDRTSIGVTQGEGVAVRNQSNASAGSQQWSPILLLQGRGWKTDATAASQIVQFAAQLETVQGTANPSGDLVFKSNVNSAGYVDRFSIHTDGGFSTDGDANIGGDINHDGSNVGFYSATPVAQPSAYTMNATVVTDKTLLASASATATNNNNVLAALITDLQALGLIA